MHFTDLPFDCLFALFKYFSIEERVKLERVSADFGAVLEKLWKGVQVLSVRPMFLLHHELSFCTSEFDQCFGPRRKGSCPANQTIFISNFGLKIRDRTALQVLKKTTNLRSLYWEQLPFDEDVGFKVGLLCPQLEHLTIKNVRHAGGLLTLVRVLRGAQGLQSLQLEAIEDRDFDIDAVLEHCPRLETLRFDKITKNRQVLARLGDNLRELWVDFDENSLESTLFIETLSQSCKRLQRLHLLNNSLNEPGVMSITANLKQLNTIAVTCNSKLLPYFNQLPYLKKFSYRPETRVNERRKYDEGSFMEFAAHLGPKLTELSLKNCDLDDNFLEQLHLSNCHFHQLRSLEIEFSAHVVSDRSVLFLSKCSDLKILSLSQTMFTESGLKQLLFFCPKLQEINIEFSPNLNCALNVNKVNRKIIK